MDSGTPSNTGVATGVPGTAEVATAGTSDFHAPSGASWTSQPCLATHPRWVSSTWPTFIRPGTPSGLRITSTAVPSSRNGMSSTGRIFEMTPLLP